VNSSTINRTTTADENPVKKAMQPNVAGVGKFRTGRYLRNVWLGNLDSNQD
jgi:hypothetical protein